MKRVLVLVLALLLVAGCGRPPESSTPAPDGLAAEERRAYQETIDRFTAEIRELRAENDALVERLEKPTPNAPASDTAAAGVELRRAQAEAQRYRSGLEAAVAELNRLRQALSAEQSFRRRSTPPPEAYVYLLEPYVEQSGMTVYVVGAVHNTGLQPVTGYVIVELYQDDRLLETEERYLEIAAGVLTEYRLEFTAVLQGPVYHAQVAWTGA